MQLLPQHSERAHSPLGASACSRWWNCPGSIHLSRNIPSRSSVYAKEGTVAHELAQKCLESGKDAHKFLGNTIDEVLVTEEMVEAVQEYVDECRTQAALGTRPPMIETRISLARLNPPDDMFGTADFMVVQGPLLVVLDLKYGKGVAVAAEGNPQLKYYALGALYALPDDIGIQRIRVGIVQPRAAGETIKYAEYDVMELLEWSIELIDRARVALVPTAEVNPGSWCRFCPASGVCPAQAEKAMRAAQDVFTVDTSFAKVPAIPTLSTLTVNQLAVLLDAADQIEDLIKAARSAATAMIEADPLAVPGWEMAPKRGTRQWVGESSAEKLLLDEGLPEDKVWKRELVSPAQAEDALARELKDNDPKTFKTLKAAKEYAKERLKHNIHSISTGLTLRKVQQDTVTSAPQDVFSLS